jgi:UDP-N-acetylglucosamine transferase subunit ALG13
VIFVTVGGSRKPFPRLTRALASLPLAEVVVQSGPNPVPPGVGHSDEWMEPATMREYMERADVVVSHSGSGSVISARRAGHTPVVVPRLARFGETVDDHQAEFAAALEEAGQAVVVWDIDELADAVARVAPRRAPGDGEAGRALCDAVRLAISGYAYAGG